MSRVDEERVGVDVALAGVTTLHAGIRHRGQAVVPVADLSGPCVRRVGPEDAVGDHRGVWHVGRTGPAVEGSVHRGRMVARERAVREHRRRPAVVGHAAALVRDVAREETAHQRRGAVEVVVHRAALGVAAVVQERAGHEHRVGHEVVADGAAASPGAIAEEGTVHDYRGRSSLVRRPLARREVVHARALGRHVVADDATPDRRCRADAEDAGAHALTLRGDQGVGGHVVRRQASGEVEAIADGEPVEDGVVGAGHDVQ